MVTTQGNTERNTIAKTTRCHSHNVFITTTDVMVYVDRQVVPHYLVCTKKNKTDCKHIPIMFVHMTNFLPVN